MENIIMFMCFVVLIVLIIFISISISILRQTINYNVQIFDRYLQILINILRFIVRNNMTIDISGRILFKDEKIIQDVNKYINKKVLQKYVPIINENNIDIFIVSLINEIKNEIKKEVGR